MKTESRENNGQSESNTRHKIFLDEDSSYPKQIIYRTKKGETKLYRLVRTKFNCLTLNK